MGNGESGCAGRRRPAGTNRGPYSRSILGLNGEYDGEYERIRQAPRVRRRFRITEQQVSEVVGFTGAERDVCRRVIADCDGNCHAAAERLLLSGGERRGTRTPSLPVWNEEASAEGLEPRACRSGVMIQTPAPLELRSEGWAFESLVPQARSTCASCSQRDSSPSP